MNRTINKINRHAIRQPGGSAYRMFEILKKLQLPSFLLAKERVNERSPVRTGGESTRRTFLASASTHPAIATLGIPLSGRPERGKKNILNMPVHNAKKRRPRAIPLPIAIGMRGAQGGVPSQVWQKWPSITLLFFTTILCSRTAYAQTQPGFVQQDVIKISGIATDAQTWTLPATQKQTTRVYYDGLGRPLQTIALQASPAGNDMIQPIAYDNLGRQTISYLPYAGKPTDATGSYRPNAISTGQPAFYDQTSQYLIPVDTAPHSRSVFEKSPLQRLLSAGMPGTGFQPGDGGTQHYKTVTYRPSSTAIDGNILQWNPDGSYTANTYYGNDALWVTDGVDEDLVETRTFVDLAGHTILKRQVLSSGNLDTYYIYNNAGMLMYTVPPKAAALLVPTTSFTLTGAPLSNLVFYFVYDNMGRVVQKTVPAKGVAYIVYDPLNRPVLVQDANMRANNNWSYIKYDVKGRVISQGTYNDATHTTLSAMQTYVNGVSYAVWYESRSHAAGATGYYTNLVFPTTGTTPLAYAYYDDYNMTESGSPDFSYVTQSDPKLPGEEMATGAQLKGMPTMVTQTTVGSGLTGTWLTTVTFYDRNLHPIQVRSNNHVYYTGYAASANLTDTKTVANDFTGMPLYSKVAKQTAATGGTTTVYTAITYDQVYRVSSVSQAYNSGAYAVVATYNYNELGQVIKKNLGQLSTATIPATISLNSTYSGTNTFVASSSITMTTGFSAPSGATFKAYIATNYLQNVDYRYNIRGQVLSINNSKLSNDGGVTNTDTNDLFGMLFLYDQKDGNLDNNTGNSPSYDGKLSAVKWMTKDARGNSSYERSYIYSYDGVNRYVGETYSERTPASIGYFSNNLHGFDENNITYDAGGNILTLQRNSSTQGTNSNVQIDNLTYGYSSASPNQLSTVTDGAGANYTGAGFRNLTGSTGSYSYDANGNLVADPYKGLAFDQYNVLNRPDKITVTAGTGQYINYTYDASGNLIRKQEYNGGTLITQTDYIGGFVYLNGALSYFPMPEGRVLNNSGTLKQEFIITDGQGNARVSFQDNGSGTAVVTQETSYYGFGLQLLNSPVSLPPVPNKQLYNGGSEWQNDYSNLPDYYQTFYRNYDAAIGRFIGIDPAAESAESMTGYQYAGNIPTMLNDPDGDLPMPGSHNPPPSWQPYTDYGGGVPGDIQAQQDAFLGGGTGLYGSDPSLAWYLGISTGNNIYNASAGTGISIRQLTYLLNSNSISVNGDGPSATLNYDYSYTKVTSTYLGSKDGQDYWRTREEAVIGSGSISLGGGMDDDQGGDPPLTHAQELAKYGQVTWGFSFLGSAGILNRGYAVEYGFVQTDKFWRQAYHTVYNVVTTLTLSANGTEFIVNSNPGYITTFSDWAGPVEEGGGNYIWISGSRGWSAAYTTWGIGGGGGISLPIKGTGAYLNGTTVLDGSPVYVGPPNYDNYNPAIPHL